MFLLDHQWNIVEKIFRMLSFSSSVKERKLKWRVKRGVTGLRPPLDEEEQWRHGDDARLRVFTRVDP